jgi:hypothetical protein
MKKLNSSNRTSAGGEGLVVVIILLAIVGAGVWWLFNTKQTSDREARTFGREMIQRLTVQHDRAFFADLGPQAKMEYPQTEQLRIIAKLTELGVPAQPIKIDENVTFESKFFSPRGFFTAHLNYPAQPYTLELAVSHPVGKWQIDNLTLTPGTSGSGSQ